MSNHIDLHGGRDWPDAGEGMCCMGAAVYGPERCTCWEPVYDLEQCEPDTDDLGGVRSKMCEDCAFRSDSPERTNADGVGHDAEDIECVVDTGVFFCHQGIRRPVVWRHPSGVEVPGDPTDYSPPIIEGIPYKADGSKADVCAGFLARKLRAAGDPS